MTTQATCVYNVARGGLSNAALLAAVAAVVVPPDPLQALGIRLVSESTITSGNFAVRTSIFSWAPVSNAALNNPSINANNQLNSLTVASAGSGYVLPPVVAIGLGGPLVNAKANAFLKVVSDSIVANGTGYSAATFATVVGQLAPSKSGARTAQLVLTIVGGAITAVSIVDAGSGYVGVPKVVITDPGVTPGSGGVVTVSMGVDEIQLVHPGEGFDVAPSLILIPAFEVMFPSRRDRPFFNMLTTAISQAVMTPVKADMPVLS